MTVNFQTSKSIYDKNNNSPINNGKKIEPVIDKQINILHTEITTSETLQLAIDTKKKSITPNIFSFKIDANVINTGKLQVPSGYKPLINIKLASGVNYTDFSNGKAMKEVRAVTLTPANINRLNVHFQRESGYIDINKEFNSGNHLMIMNGTLFGGYPAGDIKGTEHGNPTNKDVQFKPKPQAKNIVTNAENKAGAMLEKRYTFAIRSDGKPVIFQGGLESKGVNDIHDQKKYRVAMGGGVLLFDSNNPNMYNKVGTKNYNDALKAKNDNKILKDIGTDSGRQTPRSSIGILKDGSTILVNFGEGKYRDAGGFTVQDVAKVMKEMGCVSAMMFDGGGAPTFNIKDSTGKTIIQTTPDISPRGGYDKSKAIVTITR